MDSILTVSETGDVAVVNFNKKITSANVSAFRRDSLSEILAKKTDKIKIVINMSSIEHLDSAALGRVVGIYKMVKAKSGRLVLSNLNDDIANLIHMCSLDKIIDVCDNEEEALKNLSQ